MSGFCDPSRHHVRRPRKPKPTWTTRKRGNRSRGKPAMESAQIDWIKGDPKITIPPPDTMLEVSYMTNEMHDTYGYPDRWMNPLIQEKYRQGDTLIPPITLGPLILLDFNTTSPSFRRIVRETLPFLTPEDLDELQLKSQEKLSSVVEATTSIANFFIELIEALGDIAKHIKNFEKLFEKIQKLFIQEFKRLLKQGKSEQEALWLAWNFTIKPTLGDLHAIFCSIYDAKKKLDWLRERNGKITELSYRRELGEKVPLSQDFLGIEGDSLCNVHIPLPEPQTYPDGTYQQQVLYTKVTLAYHAMSLVKIDIPLEYLDPGKGLLYMWEALMGLHNPVGIIWEAIPFSWLADYFLSYRDRAFQRMFDYSVYNDYVTVMGFGHSFTLKAEGALRVEVLEPFPTITHAQMGRFTYELKWRRSGIDLTSYVSHLRLPKDWYHLSMIGSIAVGFFRRRRRVSRTF